MKWNKKRLVYKVIEWGTFQHIQGNTYEYFEYQYWIPELVYNILFQWMIQLFWSYCDWNQNWLTRQHGCQVHLNVILEQSASTRHASKADNINRDNQEWDCQTVHHVNKESVSHYWRLLQMLLNNWFLFCYLTPYKHNQQDYFIS